MTRFAINHIISTSDVISNDFVQLVSTALNFLSAVAEREHNKDIFAAAGTLETICKQVVLPNVFFRESDQELFEDNPEEYIRRDMEGSGLYFPVPFAYTDLQIYIHIAFVYQCSCDVMTVDIDTRRRGASDLIRALSKFFEQQVTTLFGGYITGLLQVCVACGVICNAYAYPCLAGVPS